jgi:hypothetical protein
MIIQGNKLGNLRTKTLIYEYDNFEMYYTLRNDILLIVRETLYNKWLSDKLFFNVNPFSSIAVDGQTYYFLVSKSKYQLDIVCHGNPLCNRYAAVTFAFVLKQMRKVTTVSLYDGIYTEEFGYIFPTYTGQDVSDDALLGAYLTGGQAKHFSEDNIKSIFIDKYVLQEVSQIVGIECNATIEDNKGIITEPEIKNEECVDIEPLENGDRITEFKLPGRPELEQFFNDHVINILNEPERYQRLGIGFPSSIILYGPPGCGKTYAVDKLIEHLGLPRFEINSATIASAYIHDTAKKISEVFYKAIKAAPSIMVIDEMESYLSSRDSLNSSPQHLEEVAEFLRQIQEAQSKKVLIIAMTNMYDKIDPAILRRGRFDHHIEVGLPSKEEIRATLCAITKNIYLNANVDLNEISEKLCGKTLADISFVIKEAGLLCGKQGKSEIDRQSILTSIEMLPKDDNSGNKKIGF